MVTDSRYRIADAIVFAGDILVDIREIARQDDPILSFLGNLSQLGNSRGGTAFDSGRDKKGRKTFECRFSDESLTGDGEEMTAYIRNSEDDESRIP